MVASRPQRQRKKISLWDISDLVLRESLRQPFILAADFGRSQHAHSVPIEDDFVVEEHIQTQVHRTDALRFSTMNPRQNT